MIERQITNQQQQKNIRNTVLNNLMEEVTRKNTMIRSLLEDLSSSKQTIEMLNYLIQNKIKSDKAEGFTDEFEAQVQTVLTQFKDKQQKPSILH